MLLDLSQTFYTTWAGFQQAPTLGGECYRWAARAILSALRRFQQAPTLGGECYDKTRLYAAIRTCGGFNKHPPLGVNATMWFILSVLELIATQFQRAPTLGGECYSRTSYARWIADWIPRFQRAPTLGGECYTRPKIPTGGAVCTAFQRAPTLGGECYGHGTPRRALTVHVSTGTHPWG